MKRETPFLISDHIQISASSMAAKNWAELPRELLGQILKKLCITNIDSFKLVCHCWHSTVQEEASLSLLCPAPSPPWLTINNDSPARLFNLVNKKVYRIEKKKKTWPPSPKLKEAKCVGSSHGWLAFVDNFNCAIYLTNPFKPDKPYIQLPPIETLPCIEGKLGSSSSSSFLYGNNMDKDQAYLLESNMLCHYIINKLVMSSAPPTTSSDKDEYTVMIIYGHSNELAFCKSGDTSWTKLYGKVGRNNIYKDLYYSSNNQRCYVLSDNDCDDSIEVWDLSNSNWPKSTCINLIPVVSSWPPCTCTHEQFLRSRSFRKKYLAESCCGDLLLVVKYMEKVKTIRFDVHKLDWVKKEWVQVECLGEDDMLFLGVNNAMSISASSFPGFQGNSIYFTDDSDSYCRYEGGYDLGVFSFEDNRVRPCHYPCDFKTISPSAVWISPNPW